jgi:iron complex outermembrane receptor protein
MRVHRTNKVTVTAAVLALSALPLNAALSADPETSLAVDLDSQSLEAALVELSKQGHLQLVIATGSLPVKISAPLHGRMSLGVALDYLLKDTGLTYKFVGSHTIAIVKSVGLTRQLSDPPTSPGASGVTFPGTPIFDGNTRPGDQDKSAIRGDHTVNHRSLMLRIAALLGICVSTSISCAASAQTATTDAPTKNTSKSEGFSLEEVIVTAERRSENLQVVPITVTVLTGEDIRKKNITDPQDFNFTIPALTVAPAFFAQAMANYTIRGQGQTLGGGDPAVTTYFNDVPTPAAGPGYLFDLASVEVLKGPQGTLFGRNSTGGAVLFVPQRPTNEFGGYVDVQIGNYAARRYQAAVNFPIVSDVLFARLAVDANYRDGYTTNPLNGQQYGDVDYQGVRLGMMFMPSAGLENYLLANIATLNEHGPGAQCIQSYPTQEPTFAAPCAAQLANGPRKVNLWVPPGGQFIQTRNYAVDNTTTIKLADDFSLKNILGFRRYLFRQSYDNYGMPFPQFEIIDDRPYWSSGQGATLPSGDTYSEEIQLRGNSFQNRLHWTSGLYYETTSPYSDQDHDLDQIRALFLQYVAANRHGNSKAVFGQLTYDLTGQLKVTGGARYTEDARRQVSSQYIPALFSCMPGQPFPTAPGRYCDLSLAATFRSPTWNISLQYQLNPDTMFYLASRRGYKSGGFNNTAPDAATQSFQPEHVTDVELGAKTEFQSGDIKGRVNVDVFHSKFTGWQERVTEQVVTAAGPQFFALITNVGEGVVDGAEIEATIIPTGHIELSGFYSYLRPYFTSNMFQGVDYTKTVAPEYVRHKASVTVRYLFGLPSTVGDASVSATYAYKSTEYGTLNLSTGTGPTDPNLPPYSLLNLHADWNNVLGHPLDISAFVENATDKLYLLVVGGGFDNGEVKGVYAPPRMFGVSARWRF